MTSSSRIYNIPEACRGAGFLLAGCLIIAATIVALAPSPARAVPPAQTYYSDILRNAMHDPAFADTGYKTRRDILSGVTGPETWVEHFVSGGDVIETLTYNNLTYGIIVKHKSGATDYWAVSEDRRSYTLSTAGSPSGWTIKNAPAVAEIVSKVKALIAAVRYDDVISYITENMRNNGIETAELYFYRGFAYDQLGEVSYAKPDYRRAISIDPTIADAYYNLAIIYRNEGNPAEAVPLFERFLQLSPVDPTAADIKNYINSNK